MSAILTRWVMLTSKEPFRSANNPPRINTPDNAHRMMMKGFFVRGEGPISSAAAAVMVAGTVPSPLLTSRKPMPSCCPLPKPVPLLFGRSSFDCSKPKPSSTGCTGCWAHVPVLPLRVGTPRMESSRCLTNIEASKYVQRRRSGPQVMDFCRQIVAQLPNGS